ncbi:hypothetical protein BC831DRAFT_128062 [Entophlyctis helioformis]|nr:hypothetical protein BC831DRAFT_128062 [Entophlyctis helioformis]
MHVACIWVSPAAVAGLGVCVCKQRTDSRWHACVIRLGRWSSTAGRCSVLRCAALCCAVLCAADRYPCDAWWR